MIGNIVPGRGFGGSIRYDLEKDGAQILDTNTLCGIEASPDEIAQEMAEHVARENPRLKHSLFHISISAAPGEHLTDEQWRALTRAYLEKMGFSNTHYVSTRHADTDHDHVHLTISRVDFDGNTISDSNDFIRQEQALDEIEEQFGFVRVREEMRAKIRESPMVALENLLAKRVRVNADQLGRQIARYFRDPTEQAKITASILEDRNTVFLGQDGKGRNLYSTREVVAEWQALRADLQSLADQRHNTQHVRAREATPAGISFDPEGDQAAAIKVATSGRGLVVLTGYAGTGKTTLLAECRREWEAQGKTVIGAALAGKAASGLAQEAGIESSTITKMLRNLERGHVVFDADTVLVIDEASMADNKQMRTLMRAAREAGTAVILARDREQLGSIERGGASDIAARIAGEINIRTVQRQRDTKDDAGTVLVDRAWMRAATVSFGDGRSLEGVQAYLDQGRLTWASSRGTARAELAADYLRAVTEGADPASLLALAHSRKDVADLNAAIRAELESRAKLGESQVYTVTQTERDKDGNIVRTGQAELRLAAGDRIVCTRNDYKADLRNGQFGTVLAADGQGIRVRFDGGTEKEIKIADYEDIQHGYASTIHKSQGATVDRTFVLASQSLNSHLSYVSLSRHRYETQLYAGRADFEDEAELREVLARRPPADGLDGFNLDDTETADMESDYDDQRRDLTRTHRELAARSAPALESAAEADLHRPGAAATRVGRDALRLLPGSDLAGAIGGRMDRPLHDFSRRGDATERDLELRGVQHRGAERGQEGARAVTHYENFTDLQRAVRAEVAARGLSDHTAALARREAFEPDTLRLSPRRTNSPTRGSHLVARSRATGQEQILTDREGQRFQFESGAEALEARNAVRELAQAQLGKPSERPEHHIPDQRDADQYHMTREIKTEAKLGGVELRGPDNERRPELAEPSEHALDLVALAGHGQYQLRAEPNERGGWRLEFYDKTNTTAPEILTNSAGRQLAYESKAEAERDLSRLGALAEEQIQAQDRENDRGGRSR